MPFFPKAGHPVSACGAIYRFFGRRPSPGQPLAVKNPQIGPLARCKRFYAAQLRRILQPTVDRMVGERIQQWSLTIFTIAANAARDELKIQLSNGGFEAFLAEHRLDEKLAQAAKKACDEYLVQDN